MLCARCQEVFSVDRKLTRFEVSRTAQSKTPEYYPHHPSGASILTAIVAGCRLCRLLWHRMCDDARLGTLTGYQNGQQHEPSTTGSIWYSIFVNGETTNHRIYFLYGFKEGQSPTDNIANPSSKTVLLFASRYEMTGVASLQLKYGSEVDASTNSNATWSLISKWIHECRTRHPKCTKTTETVPWQPTRLLYVGNDQTPALNLHISDRAIPAEPYLSLSHCWGKIQIKRLLTADMKSMIENIEIRDLPKTFRDAIAITRKLGVRFLWIDSLCIVQDSVEDWQTEALTMQDVYRYAQLNIAATGSTDGNGGCFVTRDPLLVQSLHVNASWKGDSGSYCISNSAFWRHGVNRAPLNTRAWVLQERVLAPRTLHFGADQVYWECNEKNACETFPDGVPASMIDETDTPRIQAAEDASADGDGARLRCFSEEWFGLLRPDPAMKYYDMWSNTVTAYTRCHLTYGTDKLIALSGVVKQFQDLLQDEYLAGIWKRHLPYHLLWFKERPSLTQRATDSQNYRAPSWSWASVDGEIMDYPISNIDGAKLLIQIKEIQTYAVNVDTTGQCKGGLLRLRAFLKPAKCSKVEDDDLHFITFDSEDSGGGMYEGLYQTFAFPDYVDISQSPDIFCMPIHTFEFGEEESRTYGLILEKTGEDEATFKRVGQFKSEFDDCRIFDQAILQLEDVVII